MNQSDRDMLLTLVKGAPGPAPWYVRGRDSELKHGGQPLKWVEADPEGPFHGEFVLDHQGSSLLFVRMYTIVAPLEGNRVLLAFKRKNPDVLVLHLFKVDDLVSIDDPRVVCRIAEHPDQPYCAAIEPEAQVIIPRRMTAGNHPFRFPPSFSGIGEVCLVTTLVRPGGPANEARNTAVLILHPETHRLEVFPQTWFNDGPYTQGYQWITRAARDPFSDKIVGEGIRLGYFLLNEKGDDVELWLEQNKNHMP